MTRKLKAGIIGLGGISNLHAGGWAISEHAELVAGSDVNPAVFESWIARNGPIKTTTEAEELIADPEIDIIDICAPNNYHTGLVVAALDAGKHVLCEKPLAPKPADIQRMIAARDRSGKLLMTAQHHRFSADSRALKAEIEAGALGRVYHARSWMLRRAAAPLRPGFIMMAHSGGGPTIDIGVHILDLTLWFMGNPQPERVTGSVRAELAHQPGAFSIWGGDVPPEYDVEDFAVSFVRFQNGATLILETSWLLHHNVPDGASTDMQMWLYGTKGGAHWPTCQLFEANNQSKQLINRQLMLTTDSVRAHHHEIVTFAQAIVDGAPSPVPAEQSLQVAQILDATYQSQQAGQEVAIDHS